MLLEANKKEKPKDYEERIRKLRAEDLYNHDEIESKRKEKREEHIAKTTKGIADTDDLLIKKGYSEKERLAFHDKRSNINNLNTFKTLHGHAEKIGDDIRQRKVYGEASRRRAQEWDDDEHKKRNERLSVLHKSVAGMKAKEKEIMARIPTLSTKAKNFAKIQLERIKKGKTYLIGKAKVHFGDKNNKEANITALRQGLKTHDRVIKGLKDPNRADLAKAKMATRKSINEYRSLNR